MYSHPNAHRLKKLWRPGKNVFVIIPGFDHKNSNFNTITGKALWKATNNCNIFSVDWSGFCSRSHRFLLPFDYIRAVSWVPKVGKTISLFVQELCNEFNIEPEQITFIGHSLGCHVIHSTSEHWPKTRKKFGTIIGLDPAGPLYGSLLQNERLNKDDATNVVAVHTNGGCLGIRDPIGSTDIYVSNKKSVS